MDNPLLRGLTIGAWTLPNRVWMAPLTRSRAISPGDVPHQLNAHYYAQRASAGLIISEATQISPEGKGYAQTPGIYSDEQVAGWRLVTDAVHRAGGRIIAQLWHVGRISHRSLQPAGQQPVAPSAVRAERAKVYIDCAVMERVPVDTPRALAADELPGIVADYRRAARNAQHAGFDGVELHGANGYLIDEFLRDGANQRDDQFGGAVENRCRFPVMVMQALVDVWGADRVGVRVSPTNPFNGMSDSDPVTTFGTFASHLRKLGVAFIEVVEQLWRQDEADPRQEAVSAAIREAFGGAYVANGNYTPDRARDVVAQGRAAAVTFGRPFIANPDLPERIRRNAGLNEWDERTFYCGAARGYTDYPALEPQPA